MVSSYKEGWDNYEGSLEKVYFFRRFPLDADFPVDPPTFGPVIDSGLPRWIRKTSLHLFGAIRTGALKPRVKRKALTESTSPPDQKVGVAAAHVQAVPSGWLKVVAVVFARLSNTPATLGNLGGWFGFQP
jgi:hypothetical protein